MTLKDFSKLEKVGMGGGFRRADNIADGFSMVSLYNKKIPVKVGSLVCFSENISAIDRICVAKITSLSKKKDGNNIIYCACGDVLAKWYFEHSYIAQRERRGDVIDSYIFGYVPSNVPVYWLRGELLDKFKREFAKNS